MGDTDGDTLANIIRGDYDFDYQEFDDISDECQDLIQRLIVKDKRYVEFLHIHIKIPSEYYYTG